jgi:DNA-binding IclR family transcriptional regulator
VHCPGALRARTTSHSKTWRHATSTLYSIGKAILSRIPEPEARKLLGPAGWERSTARTHSSWTELLPDLDSARITGIARDFEEHVIGVAALSAPICTLCGKMHALTIPAPVQRIQEKRALLERSLKRAKREIDELIRVHQI